MGPRLLDLTSKDVERILRRNGFRLSRTKGSHQQFVGIVNEPRKRVTVTTNQNRLSHKTLSSMIRQSGFSEEEGLSSI